VDVPVGCIPFRYRIAHPPFGQEAQLSDLRPSGRLSQPPPKRPTAMRNTQRETVVFSRKKRPLALLTVCFTNQPFGFEFNS
jgi:hypothetical protein